MFGKEEALEKKKSYKRYCQLCQATAGGFLLVRRSHKKHVASLCLTKLSLKPVRSTAKASFPPRKAFSKVCCNEVVF